MTGSMVPGGDKPFLTRSVAIGVAFFLSLFGIQALWDSAAARWFSQPIEGVTLRDVIGAAVVAVVWTLVMHRWSGRGSADSPHCGSPRQR